jgi:hypothetical protein
VWLTPEVYTRLKWAGIIVNYVVVTALAIARFFLWYELSTSSATTFIIQLNVGLMFATEAVLLVSVVLMGDTLRRLSRSFVRNPKFLENQSTMRMQVVVIACHLLIEIVLIELIEYSDVH